MHILPSETFSTNTSTERQLVLQSLLVVADLDMEHIESQALASFSLPLHFHHHQSSIEPRFQFRLETEVQLALLDVQVTQNPDRSIDTSARSTSTNTKKYFNFTSHHPLANKIAVERTLHSRAHTLDHLMHPQFLGPKRNTQVLAQNSYPPGSSNITPSHTRPLFPEPKHHITPPQYHTYVRNTSGAIRRILTTLGIRTTLCLTNTLCQP